MPSTQILIRATVSWETDDCKPTLDGLKYNLNDILDGSEYNAEGDDYRIDPDVVVENVKNIQLDVE